jgi:Zn-dependent protease
VIRLFRARGIPVRIDGSWLLIFGLVTWSLAGGYFPRAVPAQSPVAYWLYGVLAAALLFVSVFLHELSHAVVALDQGVPVRGITLHVFGGVSQLEAEPRTPRAELLIAVVGPLTSFAVAGTAHTLSRLVDGAGWPGALLSYLAAVNLLLGVFNLLPGFPLDGGRVLHAALWWWTGGAALATRIASGCGVAVGFVLIALGAVRAVAADLVGGLWLVLIGVFLSRAARASYEMLRVRARLERVRVADVMTRAPLALDAVAPLAEAGSALSSEQVIRPDDSAWQALQTLARTRADRLAVVDGRALVGVVRDRDLRGALAATDAPADGERRAA